jgi:type VI secretion system secreted protein VgrG
MVMAGVLKQDERIAKLTTPLGADALAISRFSISEGLSELFECSIDALSATEDVDFNSVIGQACTISFVNFGGTKRYYSGLLTSAEWHGKHDDVYAYHITLRPWLWCLQHVSDCRIFHEKNVTDIIRDVFNSRGFQDVRVGTTQSYPEMEYTVQYNESDLYFVQRLMEKFGIYYFFEHQDGKHTLVLADSKASHKPCENLAKVRYQPQTGPSRHDRQYIETWVSGRRFNSGKVAFNDYNFKTPTANMLAKKAMPEGYARDQLEIYGYPGGYPKLSEGEDIARARIEGLQSQDRHRSGMGDAASLVPGGLVTLEAHPRGSENNEYLVVRCRHHYESQSYRSTRADGGKLYSGTYEFVPSDRKFHAPVKTPLAIVHGPQTAVVTGDAGEEIDVDKYGRILVRFHWDRDKGKSCRVRVAQVWAGKSWGGQVVPRIGQEVVVEFLEGDPDRPLVIGAVYNEDNMPPYALPDNKTMAGIKSNSTKGGNGYNEFVFEDKKDSEKIRMHGERDHEVVIRNMETVQIGEAFSPPVGSPSRSHEILNGDESLDIANGNQKLNVARNRTASVGGDDTLKITQSLDVKANLMIEITAGLSIELKAPGGSIRIDPTGVTIKGVLVQIN